jgi:hypothetical protein
VTGKGVAFYPPCMCLAKTPSVVQIGSAWLPHLSGWQLQGLHPPHHASEHAPRQLASFMGDSTYRSPGRLRQAQLGLCLAKTLSALIFE